MTTAIVRIAPLWTLERHNDPDWNRADRTLYQPGALKFKPAASEVPLLVDHDDDRVIGRVTELFTLQWVDGPWVAALCRVDKPPSWLRKYETKASFRHHTYERRTFTEGELIAGALVTEVSVLSPGVKPDEPRAEVLSVRRDEARPTHVPRRDISAGEQIIIHGGAVIHRPSVGHVIAVR